MVKMKLFHIPIFQKKHIVRVISPNNYPDFLKWIPGTDKIINYDSHPKEANEFFIFLESKITSLLVVSEKDFKAKKKKLKGIIHIHSLLEKGIK